MTGAVIFDWDGTLWDALDFIVDTYTEVFNKVGVKPWTKAEFRLNFRHDWKAALDEMGLADHEELLVSHWEKRITDAKPHAFPWVRPLFEALSTKTKLAVASSAPKKPLLAELKRSGLAEFLGSIVGADDVKNIKPDPEPLLVACATLDCDPADCIYVGDMAEDVMAAKACGMISCAVSWGIHEPVVLMAETPDFMADDHKSLQDFIMESL